MPYLAFDIETVMNEGAKALFAEKEYKPDPALSSLDEPPQKITELKTPELREARLAEWKVTQAKRLEQSVLDQRQKDFDKAALYWWTGKIICVSCVDEKGETSMWSGIDEKLILSQFFRTLVNVYPRHSLIGKHSQEFDIPYVIGRAMAHDLGLPDHFRLAKEPMTDVNRIFSARDSSPQVTSLKNYAFGLGLPPKLGEGSEVSEWYAQALLGDDSYWEKIQGYCVHDSMLVLDILKRYQKPFSLEPVRQFSTDGAF